MKILILFATILLIIFLPFVEAKVVRHHNFTFNLPSHWRVKNGLTGGVEAVIKPSDSSPDQGQLLVISKDWSSLKKPRMKYLIGHLKRQFSKNKHPYFGIRFFRKGQFKGQNFSGYFAEYETNNASLSRKVFTVMTSTKDKIYFLAFSAKTPYYYKKNFKKAISIIKSSKLPIYSYSSTFHTKELFEESPKSISQLKRPLFFLGNKGNKGGH